VSLVSDNATTIMPVVFPALYKSSKTHWNRSIHALVYHALKVLMEINSQLFDECSQTFKASRILY
jgi:serine/threonine-protein phosphatase 2A regulatory subunit B'